MNAPGGKERRFDSLGRSLTLTYLFSFASSVIGFLIVITFSRLLTPDEWGAFAVVKRTATLVATIALLGVSVAITRYIPLERAKKSSYADYYGTNAIYIVTGTTIILIFFWITGLYLINQIELIDNVLILPLYVSIFFSISLIWQLLLTGFLRAEGFLYRFNQMTVTGQFMQLFFGLCALLLFGASAYVVVLGSAAGIVVVIGVSLIMISRLGITIFRKKYIKKEVRSELLSFGVPRMAMGIFDILIISSSLILLGFAGLTVEAGFLAIGIQFVSMLTLSFQPIAIVMLPEFSKLHGLANNEEIESKIRILIQGWFYIIFFVVLLLYSFIDDIFLFLFGTEYSAALGMIKIIIFGMIPFSLYLTVYSYINAVVKHPYLLYFLMTGVFVNILLYFWLVPLVGGVGAAIATTGGMVTLGVLVVYLLLKFQPKAFSNINTFDFVLCNTPLLLIFSISLFINNIYAKIIISVLFLLLYLYILKVRKLAWFEIVLSNITRK